MDKTILKNFAINARNKLMQEITNKASLIGITKEGIDPPLMGSTSTMLRFDIKAIEPYIIYDKQVKQYYKLRDEIQRRENTGDYTSVFDSLIEEIAYTWFNRLIAIRFMEVNNYLPDKMRVLSSGRDGVNEPEFVTSYRDTSLNLREEELEELAKLKMDGSALSMEKMFHLLFIKQCNALNHNLPELFEKTDDYAELLLTISYNDPDGVLYKLVHDIPEEYFDVETSDGNGQVEIIGWMYQYYNTERKDEVINIYKGIVKKEDIPAATQLFTTDWVVRYMVDNSLGKYWLERNPESSIRNSLEYLMPGEIPFVDEKISPEDLKVFDNAMGSGHCLSYAFDVLLMIYESKGYTAREAAKLIVEKNLYGLDIDKRAYQLAYFAIMMKARQYNRRALHGKIKTNLGVFEDSTSINKDQLDFLGQSMDQRERRKALKQIDYLIKEFENATEIGSLLILEEVDQDLISEFINDGPTEGQIMLGEVNIEDTQEKLKHLLDITGMLTQNYDVVVTNPPYLNKFSPELKKYINDNYKDYKGDLFSVFIFNNIELCKLGGYSAYMSPFVWMFIKTYERLREYIIIKKHISSLIQMEYSAFEEATVPICTFVLQNGKQEERGKYIKLSDFKGGMEVQRIKTLEAIKNSNCGYYYETAEENFNKIPAKVLAYWVSDKFTEVFSKNNIKNSAFHISKGIFTGKNEYFIRFWHEVNSQLINREWLIYGKGGKGRNWYGNFIEVLNWRNDGEGLRSFKGSGLGASRYFGKETFVWGKIGSSRTRFRYNQTFPFDDGTPAIIFKKNPDFYLLGFLNTIISQEIIKIIAPTLNVQIGDVRIIPYPKKTHKYIEEVENLVLESIHISKTDWNYFETSWEFTIHPLLDYDKIPKQSKNNNEESLLKRFYESWKQFTNSNFIQLKNNEEELNRIFIEIYGLEDELTPEVSDKDITIAKIFDTKDEIYDDIKGNRYTLTRKDVIKSFISYAVGCMFGRYSLDEEGLAYAGGQWHYGKYKSFIPTADNVLLITDEEYFEDDIVGRFIDFVKLAYGEDTLNENLKFIADSLGGKGSPKEVIRSYFIKDFYKNHRQTYKNRPIYWMYDSGRQNAFKALIYMHRYDEDTTGKVRIDHLHKLQKAYEFKMDNLKYEIENNKTPREVLAAEKAFTKLTKQLKECKDYDEKIAHLAIARIPIDLDDGVVVNHNKVQTDEKGKDLRILAKI